MVFFVSVPLIYFLIQFLPSLSDLFLSLSQSEPIVFGVLNTLIFSMSRLVGGVLFGIVFWIITRRLPRTPIIRRCIIMSAFGFVMFFVLNQGVVLISSPYPPFGLPTNSFFGLASYLLLAGIYSSAISVVEDSKLHQLIRQFAISEPKLLAQRKWNKRFKGECWQSQSKIKTEWGKRQEYNLLLLMKMLKNIWSRL